MATLFAATPLKLTVTLVLDPDEINLGDVTETTIRVAKPNGTKATWAASILSIPDRTVFCQTTAADMSVAGKYSAQVVLNFNDVYSIPSEYFSFQLRGRI